MLQFVTEKVISGLLSCLILLIPAPGFSQAGKEALLVIRNDQNFGAYTGEILKTEGFNSFATASPASLTAANLNGYAVVILPPTILDEHQAKLFLNYVKAGGNLITIQPDRKLAGRMGITATGEKLTDPYILIDTNTSGGHGLTGKAMQVHGDVSLFKTSKAETIAWLYHNTKEAAGYPAVCKKKMGRGQVITFLYHLPLNILLTRQGNFRDAGKEMDGINGIRAMDLFTNGWVDTSKNTINQADEQMRLLSHCIEDLAASRTPLPRTWYFPDGLSSLITLTNDGESSSEHDFIPQFRDIGAKGGKMTLYLLEPHKVSARFLDSMVREGHEIAAHPDATKEATHPTWKGVYRAVATKIKEVSAAGAIKKIRTNTNHWFVWCGTDSSGKQDFTGLASIEALNGIGLDANYAHYDNNAAQPLFLGPHGNQQGNYIGSGLTMKFAGISGRVIDVYQHFNNVYDQQYMEHKDQEGYFQCFKGLLDRSLDSGVYSFVSVRAHNDEYYFSREPLMKMLDYARQRGIPVWTAESVLDFLQVKDEARFSNIHWKGQQLSFNILSSPGTGQSFTCMVPLHFNQQTVKTVTFNDIPVPWSVKKVKGRFYAFIPVKAGAGHRVKLTYSAL